MKASSFHLEMLFVLVLLLSACQVSSSSENAAMIHTVSGTVAIDSLKVTLTHEHIMSNWGKDISETSEYDETALFNQVIPYLIELKSLGIHTIFDCTTAHFGRRVDLLRTIADSTGVQIVTNTGFYGASGDRYVPEFAFDATAEALAEGWIREFEQGIDGTGIRPGFIKLGFDDGTPSDIDTKLFTAGILTHLETGLTMVVHTGNNLEAAETQLQLLEQYNVSPDAWVWVHANHVSDIESLIEAASSGAWISLDGAGSSNVQEYIDKLHRFKSEDLLHTVLLSHDGNGFPAGGAIRPFDAVVQDLIPAMLANGFTRAEIDQITIQNPKEAFVISQ